MIKLGNYETSRDIQFAKKQSEHDAKICYIKQLAEKCEMFIDDVTDMHDTFYYIDKHDKSFADILWHYLIGYCRSYYLDHRKIDMGSDFSISATSPCPRQPRISPNAERGIYIRQKDNIIPLVSYIENSENTNELPMIISSLEDLLKHFPHYRDKFFQVVSDRHWDETL